MGLYGVGPYGVGPGTPGEVSPSTGGETSEEHVDILDQGIGTRDAKGRPGPTHPESQMIESMSMYI